MRNSESFMRMRTLQVIVLLIFALIVGRLAYIQLFDSRYDDLARANVLRHVVQYPPRGEVFDRNGEYLVQSRECYDLMVISSEISKQGFDTARMCDVLGLSRARLERDLANARMRPRAPRLIMNYISKEDKLRFYTVYRTVRRYPREVGGNLLGYVSEVNPDYLKRNPEYKTGDYVGMNGVESAYEPQLRGRKGVRIQEIDTHGAIKGSYMNGRYDSVPEPGRYLVSTIDARLQLLGEELMRGKVGAAVAIEPSTGEILMMVSSPTYDPDQLVGRQRGNNYMKMLYNKRHPLDEGLENELGVRFASLDDLLATCDIVSLHVPVTDETRGMVDGAFLAKMRSDGVLINTARGDIVDQEALVAALEEGSIAAAGLDTLTPEPVTLDNPLVNLSTEAAARVVFSPHVGGVAEGMFYRAHRTIWENIARLAAREELVNRVC